MVQEVRKLPPGSNATMNTTMLTTTRLGGWGKYNNQISRNSSNTNRSNTSRSNTSRSNSSKSNSSINSNNSINSSKSNSRNSNSKAEGMVERSRADGRAKGRATNQQYSTIK